MSVTITITDPHSMPKNVLGMYASFLQLLSVTEMAEKSLYDPGSSVPAGPTPAEFNKTKEEYWDAKNGENPMYPSLSSVQTGSLSGGAFDYPTDPVPHVDGAAIVAPSAPVAIVPNVPSAPSVPSTAAAVTAPIAPEAPTDTSPDPRIAFVQPVPTLPPAAPIVAPLTAYPAPAAPIPSAPAIPTAPAPTVASPVLPASATAPTSIVPIPQSLDNTGLPWDERIHSGNKGLNKDGTWRLKRGVTDELINSVTAELKGLMAIPSPQLGLPGIPSVPVAPSGPTASPAVPMAPGIPPPPPVPVSTVPTVTVGNVPVPPLPVAPAVPVVTGSSGAPITTTSLPANSVAVPSPAGIAPIASPFSFSMFMMEAVKRITAGTLTNDQIGVALAELGAPGTPLPLLANRQDLLPALAAKLGMV